MSRRSDDEMDYLLSRGKLGGSQRQRILEAALGAAREGLWARWKRKIGWSAGGLALATGVAALLVVLRAPEKESGRFQIKGAGDAPLIAVTCLGAQLSACPSGSKIAFALEGGRDNGGFLTAYADPVQGGERVWYLTNQSVGAPHGDAAPRLLPKAALIGEGQPAGRYRVHAIFSRRPVARDAPASLSAVDTLARTELELVVPR